MVGEAGLAPTIINNIFRIGDAGMARQMNHNIFRRYRLEKSRGKCMVYIKWLAGLQDAESQLKKFAHRRANDRHSTQTALFQALGQTFDDPVVLDGVDCRQIERFAHERIAGL